MKPGGDDEPVRVDHASRGRAPEITDGGHLAVRDSHIAVEPGVARPVDDPAVGDEDVEPGVDAAARGRLHRIAARGARPEQLPGTEPDTEHDQYGQDHPSERA